MTGHTTEPSGSGTALAPALIFDLDGTLIDSAPAIHAVSNAVLAAQVSRSP